MLKNGKNKFMENISFDNKKSDSNEATEVVLDLIKQTLLLNPENKKLSTEELEKMALEELFNSSN
jgi:hypothetical protein